MAIARETLQDEGRATPSYLRSLRLATVASQERGRESRSISPWTTPPRRRTTDKDHKQRRFSKEDSNIHS
jgi:hypothetical protein